MLLKGGYLRINLLCIPSYYYPKGDKSKLIIGPKDNQLNWSIGGFYFDNEIHKTLNSRMFQPKP